MFVRFRESTHRLQVSLIETRRVGGKSIMSTLPASSYGGQPSGGIRVRSEASAVVLLYRARSLPADEWEGVEQRVPITWTACHFGGQRSWFVCPVYRNGRYCGRRAAVLFAGEHGQTIPLTDSFQPFQN
jgi:hypothetical protein